jgi:hypothetical protein
MKLIVKLITAVLITSTSAQAFASQFDVYVRFKDGTSKVYANRTDSANALQHLALDIKRDFPSKDLNEIATVDSFPAGSKAPIELQQSVRPIQTVSYKPVEPAVQPKEEDSGFCSSTGCKVLVGVVALAALGAVIAKTGPAASAFPCVLASDRAKDGSRCGGRASSVREGGR